MRTNELTGFLKSVDIFSTLSEEELSHVAPLLRTREIDDGQVLFNEGDAGSEMFVVISGAVATSVRLPDGKSLDIAVFGSGDFFGEMTIFDQSPRSATCYTRGKSRLLALNEEEFMQFLKHHPHVAIKIMYKMLNITAGRLMNTSRFLSDMVQWGEGARKRAITDELTGLFNRRFLDDALVEQFRTAKANNTPVAIVMVDLDHFRDINEAYGHKTGDDVILSVAPVFKRHMAETDILARYGGDEFTFVCPKTTAEEAQARARGICEEVRTLRVLENMGGPVTRVTTSQGIAAFPQHGKDAGEVREKADQALYMAKEQGRDRVCIATLS